MNKEPIQKEEEEVKLYRHFYDNPKNDDGSEKDNEFLGTFIIPKGSMDDYSFEIDGIRKEDGKPYTIIGEEVSSMVSLYNAGTKCFIEIKPWEEWNTTPSDTFIEEIGKIFYEMEEDTTKIDFDLNQRNIKRRNEIMSLLKSSLQSQRQSILEKIEKKIDDMGFVQPEQAGQFGLHASGYNQALEDIKQLLKDNKE